MLPKIPSACAVILILSTSLILAPIAVVEGDDIIPPEVLSHYPQNREVNVPLTATIYVNFSEMMNPDNVTVDIEPFILLEPFWPMGTNLVLSHILPFQGATKYTVTVNGTDLAGNPLDGNHDGVGGDPLTWIFWTTCGGICIVETSPADGDTDVPLDEPIVILFSDPLNVITFPVDAIRVTPPATPYLMLWDPLYVRVTVQHSPFQPCTIYIVSVISSPPDNIIVPGPVPNPWSFKTMGCGPYISSISPPQTDATLDATIEVTFSVSMNNSTVAWSLEPGVPLNPDWNSDNTTLNLTHTEKFRPCTTYSLTVSGNDTLGRPLVSGPVPNPYEFDTVCTYPQVVLTSPPDNQVNVALDAPIVVTFSESMDNQSVEDSFSFWDNETVFSKSNGTVTWDTNFTVFTFTPDRPYRRLITYNVTLDSDVAHGLGNNYLDGNKNGIPQGSPLDDYRWTFTTLDVVDNTPPQVVSTDPSSGESDIPVSTSVAIVFSEAMDRGSVQSAISVSGGVIAYDFSWASSATVSFRLVPTLQTNTQYTIIIDDSAADLVGNTLQGDYSWSFTTEVWRGRVYGVVVDDANGAPIPNATVTLNGHQTLTLTDGNFSLAGVPEGSYVLIVSKEGYEQLTVPKNVGPASQDLGVIRLRRPVPPTQGPETPWLLIAIIAAVIAVLFMLLALFSRRRKRQPARFEDWKGEVAEVERPGRQE